MYACSLKLITVKFLVLFSLYSSSLLVSSCLHSCFWIIVESVCVLDIFIVKATFPVVFLAETPTPIFWSLFSSMQDVSYSVKAGQWTNPTKLFTTCSRASCYWIKYPDKVSKKRTEELISWCRWHSRPAPCTSIKAFPSSLVSILSVWLLK